MVDGGADGAPAKAGGQEPLDAPGSKQRILDAALELMSEKGYSGTSISMICRHSGLPPSSTYWHFGSKEGLLTAVVEHAARTWLQALPRWQELEGEPRERFRALLDAVADSMAQNSNPTRLIMLLALERRGRFDAESIEVIRSVRQSARSGFRLAFREIYGLGSPEAEQRRDQLAEFALAVADGAFLAYQIDASTDLRRLFRLLGDSFLALADELGPDPT